MKAKSQNGFILISVLVAVALISLLVLGLTSQTLNQIKKINSLVIEKKLETLAESGIETFKWQKKYQPQLMSFHPSQPLHQNVVRKQYSNYLNTAYYEKTAAGSFYLIYGQKGDVLCIAFLSDKLKSQDYRVVRYYDGVQYVPWQ
jgi:type II secretory pathway pseudopilin PulG